MQYADIRCICGANRERKMDDNVATVHGRTLSDGSIAWDVDLACDAARVRIACQSERDAKVLAELLNRASWFESL